MNTKLTLRLDTELIRSAKQYAKETGKPLSRIVADLFETIRSRQAANAPPPPTVRALRGVLKGHDIDEADYRQRLEDKYL